MVTIHNFQSLTPLKKVATAGKTTEPSSEKALQVEAPVILHGPVPSVQTKPLATHWQASALKFGKNDPESVLDPLELVRSILRNPSFIEEISYKSEFGEEESNGTVKLQGKLFGDSFELKIKPDDEESGKYKIKAKLGDAEGKQGNIDARDASRIANRLLGAVAVNIADRIKFRILNNFDEAEKLSYVDLPGGFAVSGQIDKMPFLLERHQIPSSDKVIPRYQYNILIEGDQLEAKNDHTASDALNDTMHRVVNAAKERIEREWSYFNKQNMEKTALNGLAMLARGNAEFETEKNPVSLLPWGIEYKSPFKTEKPAVYRVTELKHPSSSLRIQWIEFSGDKEPVILFKKHKKPVQGYALRGGEGALMLETLKTIVKALPQRSSSLQIAKALDNLAETLEDTSSKELKPLQKNLKALQALLDG